MTTKVTPADLQNWAEPALSRYVHSFAHHVPAGDIADAVVALGVVRTRVVNPTVEVTYLTSAAMATGESVTITLGVISAATGAFAALATGGNVVTVNPAGSVDRSVSVAVTLTRVPVVGEVLAASLDYTAGGDPDAPALTVTVQLA